MRSAVRNRRVAFVVTLALLLAAWAARAAVVRPRPHLGLEPGDLSDPTEDPVRRPYVPAQHRRHDGPRRCRRCRPDAGWGCDSVGSMARGSHARRHLGARRREDGHVRTVRWAVARLPDRGFRPRSRRASVRARGAGAGRLTSGCPASQSVESFPSHRCVGRVRHGLGTCGLGLAHGLGTSGSGWSLACEAGGIQTGGRKVEWMTLKFRVERARLNAGSR